MSRQKEMLSTLVQIHDLLGQGVFNNEEQTEVVYPTKNINAIRKALLDTLQEYGISFVNAEIEE